MIAEPVFLVGQNFLEEIRTKLGKLPFDEVAQTLNRFRALRPLDPKLVEGLTHGNNNADHSVPVQG